jgi:hypothetical protein
MTKATKATNTKNTANTANKSETPVVEKTTAQSEAIVTQAAVNKAEKARAIFKECYAMPQVPQRKDIIARMVKEAGLTKAGAATYLQNMKTKAGLVVKRNSTPTA